MATHQTLVKVGGQVDGATDDFNVPLRVRNLNYKITATSDLYYYVYNTIKTQLHTKHTATQTQ